MPSQQTSPQVSGVDTDCRDGKIDTELPGDVIGTITTTQFLRHVLRAVNRSKHGAKKTDKLRRCAMRDEMWDLVCQLQYSASQERPYNQRVADQIRHWLAANFDAGGPVQDELQADFEMLLSMKEAVAEARKKQLAAKQEARDLAERAMLEWDVIEDVHSEEEWLVI
ncbi:hypothetical protein BD289DRAFT_455439 [Coniella lustricola]|uniref:Uncharacterized protein n=1 Tax=Coniella lustricola TaxID=2025994 RepID=A0A2T2ZZQ3_9PEZI|nr:hypothetical protein BD289DRAFT_455439 [Coniella lustricola]